MSHGILALTFVKYVGCFLDTVYHDPAHLYNYSTKKCPHFSYSTLLTPRKLCTKVAHLVICSFALVWYPDYKFLYFVDRAS